MRILYSDFLRKKVVTEDGYILGFVSNLIVNIDSYTIEKIIVSKRFFLKSTELLIPVTSILKILEKEIIVKNTKNTEAESLNIKKERLESLGTEIV